MRMEQTVNISIIIPVYNSEKYLKTSINSCLNQTMHEIEIILVDDCSTDGSAKIINEYFEKYPDLIRTIFCAKNGRQGTARNRGLEIARGEYIAFVDSDDWIEPDMCEVLYHIAKRNNADMAGGNMFYDTNGKTSLKVYPYKTSELGPEHPESVGIYSFYCGLFCSRIYRRKMILENDIRFLERLSYEDSFFNYLTGLYANKVVKTEKAFYHYFYNPNSTTKQMNDTRQYQKIDVIEKTFSECKKRGLYETMNAEIDFKYYYMLESSVIPFLRSFDKPDVSAYIRMSNMIKKNVPNYKKNKYYQMLGKKQKIILSVLVLTPRALPLLKRFL